MTGIDLIVLAPWIAFGVGLAAICIRLLAHATRTAEMSEKNAEARPPLPGDPPAGTGSPHWRALLEARWQARPARGHRTVAGLPRRGRGGSRTVPVTGPTPRYRPCYAARRGPPEAGGRRGSPRRLAAGHFGSCEQCGSQIPAGLLAADPRPGTARAVTPGLPGLWRGAAPWRGAARDDATHLGLGRDARGLRRSHGGGPGADEESAGFRAAVMSSVLWIAAALAFGGALWLWRGRPRPVSTSPATCWKRLSASTTSSCS